MFIDEAQINVKGGDGGAGAVAFLREAHRPRGGPSGGDGGPGGDVVLVADPGVATLLRFTREIHHKAESGTHGQGKSRHGKAGLHLEVPVPPGTTVRTADGALLADLLAPGDRFVAALGGRGGRGNARFQTRTRKGPNFAEQGEVGESHWIGLELRLLADAALVGFPNAGKSTLISSVSAAKPKVADYPFTTLEPHLGVAVVDDTEIVIADIPGLVEGAAGGRGLGHRFLRHVERSRVLVILVDPCSYEETPERQREVLLDELGRYRPDLLDRPRVLVVSKADTLTPEDADDLRRRFPEAFLVSAAAHTGLTSLLRRLASLVEAVREAIPEDVGFVVHRPAAQGTTVFRDVDAWRVDGLDAERAVALSDLTDPGALAYVRDRLRRLGVDAKLDAAGARRGDTVVIGDLEFTYEPDMHTEPDEHRGRRLAGGGRKRGRRSVVRREKE